MRIANAVVGILSFLACLVTFGFASKLIDPFPYAGTVCAAILGIGGALALLTFVRIRNGGELLVGLLSIVLAFACLTSTDGMAGQPILVIATLLLGLNAGFLIFGAWDYRQPLR